MAEHAKRGLRITRDGVLFLGGLVGLAYETVGNHPTRPELLIIFAAMMGLPAFLQKDESRSAKDSESHDGK